MAAERLLGTARADVAAGVADTAVIALVDRLQAARWSAARAALAADMARASWPRSSIQPRGSSRSPPGAIQRIGTRSREPLVSRTEDRRLAADLSPWRW